MAAVALGLLSVPPTVAAAAQPARKPPAAAPGSIPAADRDHVLGNGWQRSGDVAWATSGDATGFHLLVARESTGYQWQTAVSLTVPGIDTSEWIGNACLTGSGQRAVVVYAPRESTNDSRLADRGAFAAVVDLSHETVAPLPINVSIAYFDPGCGTGETAVLTQEGGEELGQTRLAVVDATTAKVDHVVTLSGQVTSAVPSGGRIVAARGSALVGIDRDGKENVLATASGTPFDVHPDAGGVDFLQESGQRSTARRWTPGGTARLATGPLTRLALAQGTGGRVFVTGQPDSVGTLPSSVHRIAAPAGATVSSTGALAVTGADAANLAAVTADPLRPVDPDQPQPVRITATALATGRASDFTVTPDVAVTAASGGPARSPAARPRAQPDPMTDPVDEDRTCAVPRNDTGSQVYQPHWNQVEWAVDLAVQHKLTVTRPANWKGSGLPAWSPQADFPGDQQGLSGGGRVPAQIMLGIVAQESNMWQASSHAVEGETGNPLVSNFYGVTTSSDEPVYLWGLDWSQADCGYGVAQVTDGMRRGDTTYTANEQREIALDYASNVAAGVQILESKWDTLRNAGITVNNGDPARLENWFMALWAYNTGFHTPSAAGDPWGVGWANNPINPDYPANRTPFLEQTYDDARHPQDWPYEEKVLGWAAYPIAKGDDDHGYLQAWWVNDADRTAVKPPLETFCDTSNDCYPGQHFTNDEDEPAGPCARPDLTCWYHQSVTWKPDCDTTCGFENLNYAPGDPEPPDPSDAASFPPDCSTAFALPASAVIVDDVPDSVPSVRPCTKTWTSQGSFSLSFAQRSDGHFTSKIDFHQIGSGFGGHFWFAHTQAPDSGTDEPDPMAVTGTWTPPASLTGWTRIKVHIPATGAWTKQADYQISLGNGQTRHRMVNQVWQEETWVDIGVFDLSSGAKVTLSNTTHDGAGTEDIAWDAIAFVPTTKPTVDYVAMGDSYSSGESDAPYDPNSEYQLDDGTEDHCHRSASQAYPREVTLPGHQMPIAWEAANGAGTTAFAFIACSGALTTSMTDDAVDQPGQNVGENTDWHSAKHKWGEWPQIDQGYLDADTTLVTLTVGADDSRWADAIKACIPPVSDCTADDFYMTHGDKVDPQPMNVYEPKVLTQLLPQKLAIVYQEIHEAAPNAKIVVLGYPHGFPADPLIPCLEVAPNEQVFLNHLSDELAGATSDLVDSMRAQGVNITFVDAIPTFSGHEACTSDAWIHWYDIGDLGNEFHPYPEGQAAYAGLVDQAISD